MNVAHRSRARAIGKPPRIGLGRVALAAMAAGAAFFSLADSLANALASGSPSVAHKLAPWNGKIAAKLARRKFEAAPSAADGEATALLARFALQREPTAADALDVLAMQAQLRNDVEGSERMLAHSLLLSRRQLQPRLWAIQQAAIRGDIDGALTNYDIALRTSSAAAAPLFPILSAALTEPKIRAKVARLLERGPVWREDFISYAAREGREPTGTVKLFELAQRRGIPIDEEMRTALVDNLASRESPSAAWAYYAKIRQDAVRDRSRDPRFMFDGQRRSVFDWGESDFATFQRGPQGGLLEFEVPPTSSGIITIQTLLLPPGVYVLRSTISEYDAPRRTSPYWALRCETRVVGSVQLSGPPAASGQYLGFMTVPLGCPVQTLALIARSTDRAVGG